MHNFDIGQQILYRVVCPRVRIRVHKRVPSNFGPRNRVKEGTYINAQKDLDKMQDVNHRYLK